MQARLADRVREISGGRVVPQDYAIRTRFYGRDGVMGTLEPLDDQMAHEVGLLISVTAAEQASSRSIAASFWHFACTSPSRNGAG